MDTIFSYVIQKRLSRQNEDVATDALALILDRSERARTGFNKLLRGIEPQLPDLRFQTQHCDDNTRPDMCGLDHADPRVFIENKFWAGLTDNQPVAYLRRLEGCTQPSVLLVVAPRARQQTIQTELLRRLDDAEIQCTQREVPRGLAISMSTSLGPSIALTSWDVLIAGIEREAADEPRTIADLAQLSALCDAADIDAFVPFSPEDLSDQRLPAFLLQLNAIVDDAIEAGSREGILDTVGLKQGNTARAAGRYARLGNTTGPISWLGVHFELWKRYGESPVWLMFPDEPRSKIWLPLLDAWGSHFNCAIQRFENYSCVGIRLPIAQEKDAVVASIRFTLRSVAHALNGRAQSGASDSQSDP